MSNPSPPSIVSPPPSEGNRVALASLILGILSFAGGFTALPGIFCGFLGLNRARRTGTGQGNAVAGIVASVVGIPVGLWLGSWLLQKNFPAPPAADDSEFRTQSSNNLHQIGIALQNFDADRGSLPLGANCDDEGKPLLSWRVSILPQLGQQALYQQFNLSEPWDSPTNKALIAQMPEVYADPQKPADRERGRTLYKVFVGEKAVFSHVPRPREAKSENESLCDWSINDLYQSPRGLSNIVLVVEAGDAVTWTKPSDLPYQDSGPLPNLKSPYVNAMMALMGDGRVITARPKSPNFAMALRASIDPTTTSPFMLDQ